MLRRYWKKGALALLLLIALIFMFAFSACGGSSGGTSLSPFQVLNNTVKSHNAKIDSFTSKFTTTENAIGTLRTDLEAIIKGETPISGISIVDYSGNITSLQAQINSLKATDNSTQIAIDILSGKVETMKTNLATMQLLVDNINSNVLTLSTRINVIEVALNLSP